jgi:hypothetical protein
MRVCCVVCLCSEIPDKTPAPAAGGVDEYGY